MPNIVFCPSAATLPMEGQNLLQYSDPRRYAPAPVNAPSNALVDALVNALVDAVCLSTRIACVLYILDRMQIVDKTAIDL